MYLADASLSGVYFLWWLAQVLAVAVLIWAALRWRPGFLKGKTIGSTVEGALKAREDQIRFQLEAAERSRQEAARIQAEARRELDEARVQADEIVGRAQTAAEAIQREITARADEEAERVKVQANEEIEYERRQALNALKRRAADIVIDAAGQIVRQRLTPEADRHIITESLTDLKEVR